VYSSNQSSHLPNSAPQLIQASNSQATNLKHQEVSDFTQSNNFIVYQDPKKVLQANKVKLKSKVKAGVSTNQVYQRQESTLSISKPKDDSKLSGAHNLEQSAVMHHRNIQSPVNLSPNL
jgi:hypothetical protein